MTLSSLHLRKALVAAASTNVLAAATINLWDPSYALRLVVGSAYTAVMNLNGSPGERAPGSAG